jgi:hypothetical protein
LEFLDTRAVRFRLSTDFSVPEDAPTRVLGGEIFRLIPITTLRKANLIAFDLRDENGSALWLPTSEESSGLMASALVFWARLNQGEELLPGFVEQVLRQIAAADGPARSPALRMAAAAGELIDARGNLTAARENLAVAFGVTYRSLPLGQWYGRLRWRARALKQVLDSAQQYYPAQEQADLAEQDCRRTYGQSDAHYAEQLEKLMEDVSFRSQLQELAENFVVYVGVTTQPGLRRIVKLAYESAVIIPGGLANRLGQFIQAFGLRGPALDLRIGGRGASHHLEVTAPAGVDVVSITASPVTPALDYPRPPVSVVGGLPHVHIRIPADEARYRATVLLRVTRPGWFTASVLTAAVIAVVMMVGALETRVLFAAAQATGETGTAATLLLTLLAAFATFLVRPGENPLAAKLLVLVRWLIGIDVAVVLVAVGDLVLHHHPGPPVALWRWLAGISTFVFAVLLASWLRTLAEDWHHRRE